MKKQIMSSILFIGFGVLITMGVISFLREGPEVSYIPKFEINQSYKPVILIEGSIFNKAFEGTLEVYKINCDIGSLKCYENSAFILDIGALGLGTQKEYVIIENTPSKIVAEFKGFAASHYWIIELDKNIVTFKNQSNSNSSDVALFQLEDGSESLRKYRSR